MVSTLASQEKGRGCAGLSPEHASATNYKQNKTKKQNFFKIVVARSARVRYLICAYASSIVPVCSSCILLHFAEIDLRLYFKKRNVEAESIASIKEGSDREDEENNEEDDREEIEILEEDQEASQEIAEIQEEEDGDDRQEETVEILEEEDGDARQVETGDSGRRE